MDWDGIRRSVVMQSSTAATWKVRPVAEGNAWRVEECEMPCLRRRFIPIWPALRWERFGMIHRDGGPGNFIHPQAAVNRTTSRRRSAAWGGAASLQAAEQAGPGRAGAARCAKILGTDRRLRCAVELGGRRDQEGGETSAGAGPAQQIRLHHDVPFDVARRAGGDSLQGAGAIVVAAEAHGDEA